MTTHSPAPAWYADPADPQQERWWDGNQWSSNVRLRNAQPPPPPPSPGSSPPPPSVTTSTERNSHSAIDPVLSPADPPPPSNPGTTPPAQGESSLPGIAPEGLEDERQRWLEFAEAEFQSLASAYETERTELIAQLDQVRAELVDHTQRRELQALGMEFEGEHPTHNSAQYKTEVDNLRAQRKQLTSSGRAVVASIEWAVGGSVADGKKMSSELSKLMLRAYNNELDVILKATNANNAATKKETLSKKRKGIERLGKVLGIEILEAYHSLSLKEIGIVGDWRSAQTHEKELEKLRKERLREEEKVRKEAAAKEAKFDKEIAHLRTAIVKLESDPNASEQSRMELAQQLEETQAAKIAVNERAANARAGNVYVISNPGTMGEGVVKIGMTRRLDPMDRVKELGDASVPFKFDCHAMIFSDDAVGLERDLHKRFAEFRINRMNMRREFFRVSPSEVRAALEDLNAHLVEWTEHPFNEEWEASK